MSTLFVDYPTYNFNLISSALSFVTGTLSTSIFFFWIPDALLEYLVLKLNRVNYDDPLLLPSEDTTCFIWTMPFNLAPFLLLYFLFFPWLAPLAKLLRDVLIALWAFFGSIVTAFNTAFLGQTRMNLDETTDNTLFLLSETSALDNRVSILEGEGQGLRFHHLHHLHHHHQYKH